MKLLTWLVLASAAVSSGRADAAELKIFTARALATVLEVVGPQFEKTYGHKLNMIVGFTPEYAPRIKAGEAFDVLMSPPAVIDGFSRTVSLRPTRA